MFLTITILGVVIQLLQIISGAVPVGFKSALKCREYQSAKHQHVPTNDIIIFPGQARPTTRRPKIRPKISRYPFAVLGINEEQNSSWCAGTLISDRYVLITAQCMRYKVTHVILTDGNFTLTSATARHAVKRQIKHPGYRARPVYNDIGLLELAEPVTFTEHLRPACMQTSTVVEDDGWFVTFWLTDHTDIPHFGLVPIPASAVTHEECQMWLVDENRSPYGVIEHLQMCVEEKKDWNRFTNWKIPMSLLTRSKATEGYAVIGIPSVVHGADPQVYTRVSNYIEWIESEVWPDEPTFGCNTFLYDRF